MAQPPRKRIRTDDVGNILDHECDLRHCVLSFASSSDLCTLDTVNRDLQEATVPHWENLTRKRFGLTNGKDGWRTCVSLLRKPMLIKMEDDNDFGLGAPYGDTAEVACNESILVGHADADATPADVFAEAFPTENIIVVRDAHSLNFFKTLSSPTETFKVAICGRVGSEVIVTSNSHEMCAHRGNDRQRWSLDGVAIGNGAPLLGCETHLIYFAHGSVYVYRVNPVIEQGSDLLIFCQCLSALADGLTYDSEKPAEFASWGPDESQVVFCYPQTTHIAIWKFDKASGQLSPLERINMPEDLAVAKAILSKDYVAVSSRGKKLHIFDRKTGSRLHSLCDVDEDEEIDEEELIYPLSMVMFGGDVVVASSHMGHALCIWNMRTGELLKRHNDAVDRRFSDELPNAIDVSSLVYLGCHNAFVTLCWHMYVWAFPANEKEQKIFESIYRRETCMRGYL